MRRSGLRDGDFERLLTAGRHYFVDPLRRLALQTWRLDAAMTDQPLVDYLVRHRPEVAAEHFELSMWLDEDHAGLRYENEVLVEILPPGSRAYFWKGLLTHRRSALT